MYELSYVDSMRALVVLNRSRFTPLGEPSHATQLVSIFIYLEQLLFILTDHSGPQTAVLYSHITQVSVEGVDVIAVENGFEKHPNFCVKFDCVVMFKPKQK